MSEPVKLLALAVLGLLIILVIIIGIPLAVIWSWNELFGSLHFIAYTFHSWLAISIFLSCFGLYRIDYKSKKKTNEHCC